jgi:hypothetical protein
MRGTAPMQAKNGSFEATVPVSTPRLLRRRVRGYRARIVGSAGRTWVVRGYRARIDPPRPLRMRRVRGYRARIVGSAGRTWVVRGYRARIDPAV